MTKDFVKLSETLTPAEARSQLKDNNYGVVVDSNDTPIALVLVEDLEQATKRKIPSLKNLLANIPLMVTVGSEVEIKEFFKVATLFDIGGASGAVVLRDEEIVGVLPAENVKEFLCSGYEIPSNEMDWNLFGNSNDSVLGGIHQLPRGSVICLECGFNNSLDFLDRNNLPFCQNPDKPSHKLLLP
nr:CBS domain-containing protein [Methanosarcina sp. DH2]